MSEEKTSLEWCRELNVRWISLTHVEAVPEDPIAEILDPDGWDRSNLYESFVQEPIAEEEFLERLMMSTLRFFRRGSFEDLLDSAEEREADPSETDR